MCPDNATAVTVNSPSEPGDKIQISSPSNNSAPDDGIFTPNGGDLPPGNDIEVDVPESGKYKPMSTDGTARNAKSVNVTVEYPDGTTVTKVKISRNHNSVQNWLNILLYTILFL